MLSDAESKCSESNRNASKKVLPTMRGTCSLEIRERDDVDGWTCREWTWRWKLGYFSIIELSLFPPNLSRRQAALWARTIIPDAGFSGMV